MNTLDLLFFNAEYKGIENLPKKTNYIIACNHISNLDPFIMGIAQRRKFNFLAKEELFKTKFSNWFFRSMGAFPIKRDTSDFRALREALRHLKEGRPLVLFPEGTRGVRGRNKEPQPGVGFIAVKSSVPVIPAFIKGSDIALPAGAGFFKRHKVIVTIGKPIHFSKDESYDQISLKIMEQIYSLEKQ